MYSERIVTDLGDANKTIENLRFDRYANVCASLDLYPNHQKYGLAEDTLIQVSRFIVCLSIWMKNKVEK
jgi:hypothetical protein